MDANHSPGTRIVTLSDLIPIVERHREHLLVEPGEAVKEFLAEPKVARLYWPDDVLKQWVFDHAAHFESDYGHIDLTRISWRPDHILTDELVDLPTGQTDAGTIEEHSWNLGHWLSHRSAPTQRSWNEDGTWDRSPLILSRDVISPDAPGLQVVEGRSRVGMLRGRRREGLFVADRHQVWLGALRHSVRET